MTSPISAFQAGQSNDLQPSNASAVSSSASVSGSSTAPVNAPGSSDTATITPTAQLQAQLLASARGASGIDQGAVTQLSAAINSGTYNLPADKLASAIQAGAAEAQGS